MTTANQTRCEGRAHAILIKDALSGICRGFYVETRKLGGDSFKLGKYDGAVARHVSTDFVASVMSCGDVS